MACKKPAILMKNTELIFILVDIWLFKAWSQGKQVFSSFAWSRNKRDFGKLIIKKNNIYWKKISLNQILCFKKYHTLLNIYKEIFRWFQIETWLFRTQCNTIFLVKIYRIVFENVYKTQYHIFYLDIQFFKIFFEK